MDKLTIIICNYNNGHYFQDACQSLLAQTSGRWEAVVIDDASTDNSVEVIKGLIKDDKRFRFYQNEVNLGYQQSLMKAIALTETEIFGRLDPDDALYPQAVELSLKTHEDYPEVGLVYSDITFCDENLCPSSTHQTTQIDNLDERYYLLNGEITPFTTFKLRIYSATAGLDCTLLRSEDIDIYMKMCEAAPVKRIAQSLYRYRIHDRNASKLENAERAYFWHFAALIKMSERQQRNIEDLFLEHYVKRRGLEIFIQRRRNFIDKIKGNKFLSLLFTVTGRNVDD